MKYIRVKRKKNNKNCPWGIDWIVGWLWFLFHGDFNGCSFDVFSKGATVLNVRAMTHEGVLCF